MVAPVNEPRAGYVVYENSRRAAAGRRLDRTVAQLRQAGIPAHGDVFDGGPLAAVKDVLALESSRRADRLDASRGELGLAAQQNLLEEIRKLAGDRPVEHVVSDVARRTGARTCSSSRTRRCSARRCSTGSARAPRKARRLPDRLPAERPGAAEHPEAERRLREALSTLRSEGIEAHGQVAHPDPYTAAMEVVHDERVDEIIVSTFPGRRSGWLRRDLVGRLRADADVPVEHVVAEVPSEVGA